MRLTGQHQRRRRTDIHDDHCVTAGKPRVSRSWRMTRQACRRIAVSQNGSNEIQIRRAHAVEAGEGTIAQPQDP